MVVRNTLSIVVVCVIYSTTLIWSPGGELTKAEFNRLHKLLQPSPDEPWRTIPWKITLLDAQRSAAEQRKPIFIWAMDGHPLGCT
jgi:hypothetical protein